MSLSQDSQFEWMFESSQEERDYARLTEAKDKGLVSKEYYFQFLYETGRLQTKPITLKGLAKTAETPKPKRTKRNPCTPEEGQVSKRIRAGLAACAKHVNGHECKIYN